jgi:hypothetical protein
LVKKIPEEIKKSRFRLDAGRKRHFRNTIEHYTGEGYVAELKGYVPVVDDNAISWKD